MILFAAGIIAWFVISKLLFGGRLMRWSILLLLLPSPSLLLADSVIVNNAQPTVTFQFSYSTTGQSSGPVIYVGASSSILNLSANAFPTSAAGQGGAWSFTINQYGGGGTGQHYLSASTVLEDFGTYLMGSVIMAQDFEDVNYHSTLTNNTERPIPPTKLVTVVVTPSDPSFVLLSDGNSSWHVYRDNRGQLSTSANFCYANAVGGLADASPSNHTTDCVPYSPGIGYGGVISVSNVFWLTPPAATTQSSGSAPTTTAVVSVPSTMPFNVQFAQDFTDGTWQSYKDNAGTMTTFHHFHNLPGGGFYDGDGVTVAQDGNQALGMIKSLLNSAGASASSGAGTEFGSAGAAFDGSSLSVNSILETYFGYIDASHTDSTFSSVFYYFRTFFNSVAILATGFSCVRLVGWGLGMRSPHNLAPPLMKMEV